MDLWHVFLNANGFQKAVFLVLAVFSVVAWGIFFYYHWLLRSIAKNDQKFGFIFHKENKWPVLEQEARKLRRGIYGNLFCVVYREAVAFDRMNATRRDNTDEEIACLERTCQATLRHHMAQLASTLRWLASIANTAPFVGLLGTVVGIVRSFSDIGRLKVANLVTVAPGIAEALIMTAIGLTVAIPSVIFFNMIRGHIRRREEEAACFGGHLINRIVKERLARQGVSANG